MGEKVGEPDQIVKRLLEDEGKDIAESANAETASRSELGGLRRRTDADESNDLRSLERALDRTLYLIVKKSTPGKPERWEFPDGPIEGVEGLKEVCYFDGSQGVNLANTSPGRYAHPRLFMRCQHEHVVRWKSSSRPHGPLSSGCSSAETQESGRTQEFEGD